MGQSRFGVRVVFGEPLKNHRVGAFAVELDLAFWGADDGRHAFARGVEFANVENLVFPGLAILFDKDRRGFASLGRKCEPTVTKRS